jgi:hypothetical protein
MSIKIGDTIKMNFTNQKTKVVTPGFGFVIYCTSLSEDIKSYNVFFYKKGNLYNFESTAYSGSFVNCKILLTEKIYKVKSEAREALHEDVQLIRDIQDTIPRGYYR